MKCPNCQHEFEADLAGAVPEKNPTNQFIASYAEAFKERWKTNPIMGPKNAGVAKRIVAALGPERARRYAWVYVSMNDFHFVNRQHDLVTMEQNLNKIAVAAETGKITTRNDAQKLERRQTNLEAFSSILEPDAPKA